MNSISDDSRFLLVLERMKGTKFQVTLYNRKRKGQTECRDKMGKNKNISKALQNFRNNVKSSFLKETHTHTHTNRKTKASFIQQAKFELRTSQRSKDVCCGISVAQALHVC